MCSTKNKLTFLNSLFPKTLHKTLVTGFLLTPDTLAHFYTLKFSPSLNFTHSPIHAPEKLMIMIL